jgi:hypothetical protein
MMALFHLQLPASLQNMKHDDLIESGVEFPAKPCFPIEFPGAATADWILATRACEVLFMTEIFSGAGSVYIPPLLFE